MATGAKRGLNPARRVGSQSNNKGFSTYQIASGTSNAIFTGDPVALSSGRVVRASNGSDALGVLVGVSYVNTEGQPTEAPYFPASFTSSQPILAKVVDDPFQTFFAKANGTVSQVLPGNIYSMTLGSGDTLTGRSTALVDVLATRTGDVDISAITDLGENLTGADDGDSFTIRTTQTTSATTITLTDGDGVTQLLAKLNAVPNILAELTSAGFLKLTATDGYSLVLAAGTGALIDDLFAGTAATTAPTVAANAGLVKVVEVVDATNGILEVVLVNHSYRDDG